MNCIIIDDEPLAREAMEMLVEENKELCLLSMFNNAVSAARFMEEHSVDLIFLDIQMPGITGIEFAHTVSKRTLIIFTTAYTEYALDSYEVDRNRTFPESCTEGSLLSFLIDERRERGY